MLMPAVLTTLVVIIGITDEMTLQWQTTRAIVVGPLVGLLLGDLQTGLVVGATIELMFLSNVIVGAAEIPDVTMSAAIATALCITSKVPQEVAIALAVPVAIFGQFMSTIRLSILGVPLAHLADKPAAEGDVKGVLRTPVIGLIVMNVLYVIPTFVAVNFGTDLVSAAVDSMPTRLISAFGVGSSLLAAVGFAMLLSMLKSRKLVPFLFLGYVMAAFLGLSIIGTVIVALSAAFLYASLGKNSLEEV